MDASELAELRTTYVFSPGETFTWGLTYGLVETRLPARVPDEFTRPQPEDDGPVRGSAMYFGFTLGEEAGGKQPSSPRRASPQATLHVSVLAHPHHWSCSGRAPTLHPACSS
jgi:hypothetical protein